MSENWTWPVPGYSRISSGVGPRWGSQHNGIDIPATHGTSVVASRGGRVSRAYNNCNHDWGKDTGCGCGSNYGNHVYIDHGDGYVTVYAHMSTILTAVDRNVEQGQIIGEIGSTGWSTGNHLHFEIRYEGSIRDPEDYVNPSNTVPITPPSDPDVSPGQNADRNPPTGVITNESDYTTDYQSGSTSGGKIRVMNRRVADMTTQPMHSYAHIYIGNKLLALEGRDPNKPNLYNSFSCTRLGTDAAKVTFTIFDDEWQEIEYKLSEGFNDISVEYGYVESPEESVRIDLVLQDYSISFNSTGAILAVNALPMSVMTNIKFTKGVETATKNPREAIMAICEAAGFKVDPNNFALTKTVEREENYNIVVDNAVTFILEEILPEAETPDGKKLIFEINSKNEASLRIMTYAQNDKYTYVYMKGYDSVVRELSFTVKGPLAGGTLQKVDSGSIVSIFDPLTKEESTHVVTTADVITVSEGTGKYQAKTSNQSLPVLDGAGYTSSQIGYRVSYGVTHALSDAFEAQMMIMGDPTIKLTDKIRIINVTDEGTLHHTSGIYMITGITDLIEGGDFTTSLKLNRNADIEKGIEFINPKELHE